MIRLSQMEDAVRAEFRNRQFSALQRKRVGLLHVTDMVRQCSREIFYSKMRVHNITHNYNTESLSYFFGGEAVHQLLDSASRKGQGEQPLYYNFVDDKKVEIFEDHIDFELTGEAKSWNQSDWLKILVGVRDALYRTVIDGEDKDILVDYKTWVSKGFKKREPSAEHVEQLNIYKYLSMKMLNQEITHGAVVYLDYQNRISDPLIFVKKLDDDVNTRARLLSKYHDILETVDTGDLPDRTQYWKCTKFCPYASRCFTEESITRHENSLEVVT